MEKEKVKEFIKKYIKEKYKPKNFADEWMEIFEDFETIDTELGIIEKIIRYINGKWKRKVENLINELEELADYDPDSIYYEPPVIGIYDVIKLIKKHFKEMLKK